MELAVMKSIRKILVANRGEIAARIIHTINKLQLGSVAIYASNDRPSLHFAQAGEACLLEGNSLEETYLNSKQIIDIALRTGCQAIHPGYGFLSENYSFAKACEDNGLIFIGPSPQTILLMGNKVKAREFARACNVPVPAGIYIRNGIVPGVDDIGSVQFPLIVKPSGGGGGKGMRIVHSLDELTVAMESASREALNYFGNDEVYLEEYIENGKHIEVQILGDGRGKVVHLFERECSLQRRFQKMMEESPSPSLSDRAREELVNMALLIASSANYRSAGTIEFLMGKNEQFRFLEMNTRIQVEHPVTEMVTGLDMVEEQILLADSGTLRLTQEEIFTAGHSVELRIYAEDPLNDFMPSPGLIALYREPELTGIRMDKSTTKLSQVTAQYDPLISKLIVHAASRKESLKLLSAALDGYKIAGIDTNIPYLEELLSHSEIEDGSYTTGFLERNHEAIKFRVQQNLKSIPSPLLAAAWFLMQGARPTDKLYGERDIPVWQSIGYWRHVPFFRIRCGSETFTFSAEKRNYSLHVFTDDTEQLIELIKSGNEFTELAWDGRHYKLFHAWGKDDQLWIELQGKVVSVHENFVDTNSHRVASIASGNRSGQELVHAPMHGKIIKVYVEANQPVLKGEVLMILEAMKMENNIVSPYDGTIDVILADTGSQVEKDSVVVKINV
jgi:3-methylcrotonyl-CoA carboxylase alpha subunit